MKKIVGMLVIFWTMCSYVHAQKNLQSGYIVLENSDTLRGFINYREWHRNPETIMFSHSMEVTGKRYSAKEIRYFEVSNKEAYERHVVSISLDTQLFSDLTHKNTSTKTDTIFLKVIHKGKNVNLFSYKDEVKLRWYIKQKNERPQELLNSIYRVEGSVVNEREYRAQLLKIAAVYLPGNYEISGLVNQSVYGKQSLLTICYAINGLDNNGLDKGEMKNQNVNTSQDPAFRVFAGIGLNRGTFSFSGENTYTGVQMSPSYLPVVGIGLDIYPIPSVGRLFVRNHLFVTSFKSEVTSPTKSFFQATETYYFRLTQINFSLHSQLSYNIYNKPAFKWFLGAGVGINFSSFPTNEQIFNREGLNAHTTVNDNFLDPIKKFWVNTSIRSGVAIKNVEVSLCFFPATTITEYTEWGVRNSSVQLHLNYLFRKKRNDDTLKRAG